MNYIDPNSTEQIEQTEHPEKFSYDVENRSYYHPRIGIIANFSRRQVLAKLQKLESGCLLIDENGSHTQCGDPQYGRVKITVKDARFWQEVAFGGSKGGGSAYIKGYWQCDDLVALVQLLLRNAQALHGLEGGTLPWLRGLDRVRHFFNRNTKIGSAANIAAHYDLGNDFFSLFLDQKLMYSSAFFPQPEASLEQAATAKLERICQKLALNKHDHVLEIGTGWGGFAIFAAERYGCHITTTTISKEQFNFASQKVKEAGLEDRITLLLKDYRHLEGEFDKIVSIEMIEAVGHQFLDTYIEQCSNLLVADGVLFLQAITIRDQHYEQALKDVDYIQKYVFPGGFLPSVTAISSALARASDLKIVHLEDFGEHYAKTLAHWRARFLKNLDQVRTQAFPDSFIRLWHFYLCYCEGSFREAYIGVVHLLANKPQAKAVAHWPQSPNTNPSVARPIT